MKKKYTAADRVLVQVKHKLRSGVEMSEIVEFLKKSGLTNDGAANMIQNAQQEEQFRLKKIAKGSLIMGITIFLIGSIPTLMGFLSAPGPHGGNHVVFTGALVFGFFQSVISLYKMLKYNKNPQRLEI